MLCLCHVSVGVCGCFGKGLRVSEGIIESLEKVSRTTLSRLCNYPKQLFTPCPSLPPTPALFPSIHLSLHLSSQSHVSHPRHERDQIPLPEPRRSSVRAATRHWNPHPTPTNFPPPRVLYTSFSYTPQPLNRSSSANVSRGKDSKRDRKERSR